MALPSTHEALIYLMVITSASDRDMTDIELARIGEIVRSWPVFIDFDDGKLVETARTCQKLLHEDAGLIGVLSLINKAVPQRLHDTAYALAFEVASVDLEMRFEELRVLQLMQKHLELDAVTIGALELATKARHRMLT